MEISKLTVEINDYKTDLDLKSAEAEQLNQAVITGREEKNKLSAVKSDLENAIEGSRLAVMKLQADVDNLRRDLISAKLENENLLKDYKSREENSTEILERLQERNLELALNSDKVLDLEKLASQQKVDSRNTEISELSLKLAQVKVELSKVVEESSSLKSQVHEEEKLRRCLQEELDKYKTESVQILDSNFKLVHDLGDLKAAIENFKCQDLFNEEKMMNFQEQVNRGAAEMICKEILLEELVCQLGSASENFLALITKTDKIDSENKELKERTNQEGVKHEAAVQQMWVKIQDLNTVISELHALQKIVERDSEDMLRLAALNKEIRASDKPGDHITFNDAVQESSQMVYTERLQKKFLVNIREFQSDVKCGDATEEDVKVDETDTKNVRNENVMNF